MWNHDGFNFHYGGGVIINDLWVWGRVIYQWPNPVSVLFHPWPQCPLGLKTGRMSKHEPATFYFTLTVSVGVLYRCRLTGRGCCVLVYIASIPLLKVKKKIFFKRHWTHIDFQSAFPLGAVQQTIGKSKHLDGCCSVVAARCHSSNYSMKVEVNWCQRTNGHLTDYRRLLKQTALTPAHPTGVIECFKKCYNLFTIKAYPTTSVRIFKLSF